LSYGRENPGESGNGPGAKARLEGGRHYSTARRKARTRPTPDEAELFLEK